MRDLETVLGKITLLQERISSLKAGLRTWEDHLVRVQGLREEFQRELLEMEQDLEDIGTSMEDKTVEEAPSRTLQEQLLECQVSQKLTSLFLAPVWAFKDLFPPP